MKNKVCITVDVEKEFQKSKITTHKSIEKILSIFEEYRIKGTFFVCGDFVNGNEKIIKLINKNHEVALHSYNHIDLRKLSPEKLEEQIKLGKKELNRIGVECVGFRCPYLIVPVGLGKILNNNGFLYDSSVLMSPFSIQRILHPVARVNVSGIHELPIQTITPFRIDFCLSTLRFLGLRLSRFFVPERVKLFYFHPWELSDFRSLKSDFIRKNVFLRNNTGGKAEEILRSMFDKLKKRGVEFISCKERVLRIKDMQM